MKIAIGQVDAVEGNNHTNISNLISLIKNASENDVELLIFPELTTTGYYLETIGENTLTQNNCIQLSTLAKKFRIDFLIGVSCKEQDITNNTLMFFKSNGESNILYNKLHLFPGEAAWFSRGSSPTILAYKDWKIGLSICYDLRFPELFSYMRSKEVGIIVVSAAWPKARVSHWESLLKARAIETQSYILAANRCGVDNGLSLAGNSMVLSPTGEILAQASEEPELLICDLNHSTVADLRSQFPFYKDRRIDLYRNFY